MLDNELRNSKFPNTWDATLLSMTWKCPRELYWFLRGIEYDGDSKPAYFTWGTAFQEILVNWYSSKEENFEIKKEQALQAGLDVWDKEGYDAKPANTREGLIKVFDAYTEYYPTEPWHLIEGGGELGWVYPLRNSDIFLAGSLDGYIEWPGYGAMILENKTSGGYLTDNYISQWEYSTQITNYIWYLTKLQGTEAFGCLVNMICKIIPGAKANWKTPRFNRCMATRSIQALEQYEEQVRFTINKVKEYWNLWNFPKTFNHISCSGGAGISPCKMRRVCLLDEDFTQIDPAERYIHLTYRSSPWAPWERVGEQT